jgi:DNA-binding NtrC family response regulator
LPLAAFFAERIASRLSRQMPSFTSEAEAALKAHRWPGNVRELKHVIERSVLLTPDDEITSDALQLDVGFGRDPDTIAAPIDSAVASSAPRAPMPTLPDGMPPSRSDRPPKSVRPSSRLRNYKNRADQLKAELARAERDRIIDALEQAGTQAAAAEMLGISRRALLYKLDSLGIPRPRKGKDRD